MEDTQIIDLYWQRSEEAISETAKKYGPFCSSIAYQILNDAGESEECVNDTYFKVWSLVPPKRPRLFSAFLAKITRNLSLDRYRRRRAEKRGGGQMVLALEELAGCIPGGMSEENVIHRAVLTQTLNGFLEGLNREQRRLFLGRYWYLRSIQALSEEYGLTQSKVKMTLLRLRKQLAQRLEEEGIRNE